MVLPGTEVLSSILLRFSDDGAALKGAHAETNIIVSVDAAGAVTRLVPGTTRAATQADLAGAGLAQAALAAQVQALTDQLAAMTAAHDKAVADLATAEQQLAQAQTASTAAGVVTNYQLRAALIAAGYFDQVNAYVLGLPADNLARQGWEYANTFDASSALTQGLVAPLAQLLNVSADQAKTTMDQLFATAATITG